MEPNTEKKPFWRDDGWKEEGLPQDITGKDLSAALKEGVPELHHVEKGAVIADYLFKDGLLIYHFYKRDRKGIYDKAHESMRGINGDATKQATIATEANEELAKHPWWPEFDKVLHEVFQDVFKYADRKVDYYREVDSWSVMMPEPKGPVRMPSERLEAPVEMVSIRVRGK